MAEIKETTDTTIQGTPRNGPGPKIIKTINDVSPYKVKIRTIRALPADLCGYQFDFKTELVEQGGQKVKVGVVYELDSKKFVDKNPDSERFGKTVLPEIIAKLTNPMHKMVEVVG